MWWAVRLGLIAGGVVLIAAGTAPSGITGPAEFILGLVCVFVGLVAGRRVAGVAVDVVSRLRARRKRCPNCAETVPAAARVCRYCGHSFDVEDVAEPR